MGSSSPCIKTFGSLREYLANGAYACVHTDLSMRVMNSNKTTPLSDLLLKAIEMGASGLEIEYKDGYEEINAMSDNMGFGIGRLESSGEEATLLREELYMILSKKKKTFTIAGKKYVVRVKTFDNFGEDAFYVSIGES